MRWCCTLVRVRRVDEPRLSIGELVIVCDKMLEDGVEASGEREVVGAPLGGDVSDALL